MLEIVTKTCRNKLLYPFPIPFSPEGTNYKTTVWQVWRAKKSPEATLLLCKVLSACETYTIIKTLKQRSIWMKETSLCNTCTLNYIWVTNLTPCRTILTKAALKLSKPTIVAARKLSSTPLRSRPYGKLLRPPKTTINSTSRWIFSSSSSNVRASPLGTW